MFCSHVPLEKYDFSQPKSRGIKRPNKRAITAKYMKKDTLTSALFRDPLGARTQDPNIKSVVLYQLSQRIFQQSVFVLRVQRYILLANLANKLRVFYPLMLFYLVLGICFCWLFGGFGLNIHLFFGNIPLPVSNDKGSERQGNDNPNKAQQRPPHRQ